MSTQRPLLSGLLMLALLAPSASASPAQPVASPEAATASASSGSMLIIENVGQWPDAARFQVWGSPLGVGTTWLAEDAIWITVVQRGDGGTLERSNVSTFHRSNAEPVDGHGVNVKITFPGANPDVRIEPFDPVDTTVSYFLGNDPEQWRPDVPVYGGVRYVNLYPGLDMEMTGEGGQWIWQVVASNGEARLASSPSPLARLRVEGGDGVALEGNNLRLATAAGDLDLMLPASALALQVEVVTAEATPALFHLSPHAARTSSQAPVDDPTDLLYSTFLGGSHRVWYDQGYSIAVDAMGNGYATGETHSSDFPTTPGAFDTSLGGDYDAFVAKLNPVGSGLDYATFLGGSDGDVGFDIALDEAGNAYVTGRTRSINFPTTPGAFDTSLDGASDAFVAKLNPVGSGLDYATFLGGSDGDQGSAIAVDGAGNAYLTGVTGSSDFPTTPGAFDPSLGGSYDAFVVKLNMPAPPTAVKLVSMQAASGGANVAIPAWLVAVALVLIMSVGATLRQRQRRS